MPIRNFKSTDRDVLAGMVDSFYHSPAVGHPIPVENFMNAFEDMCDGGSPYLRGLMVEHNGKSVGFCSLSFSYSTEAGGRVEKIESSYPSLEEMLLKIGK